MKRLRTILIQYRLILYCLYPLVFLVTVVMAIRNRDRRYLMERIGIYHRDLPKDCIWFHASSVGEVNGVMPLIQEMARREPEKAFLLTTGTPTGAQVALGRLPGNATHVYLPIDVPGAVTRFLNRVMPKSAIIMETELWANLFYACDRRDIPITIINARLSNKTLKGNAWMYRLYSETLSHVSKILARSEYDANAFMTIGATSSKIKVIGNIKMAQQESAGITVPDDITRPYDLAASTHDNEEELIARQWIEKSPEKLLVIAPRHPHRIKDITDAISKLTDKYAVRSKSEPIKQDTIVYIADTLGELQNLIAGADVVFVGGSLVPIGGHNVIEVLRYGKPVLFGPYMDNFKDESQLLMERNIGIKVQNADELISTIKKLRTHPESLKRIQAVSKELLEENAGILKQYIIAIGESVDKYRPNPIIR